ncbi:MAG: class I SAM-dependent methyltransferase [Pseudomonadota bacterium]
MSSRIYNILNNPTVYQLAQRIVGAGAETNVSRELGQTLDRLPDGAPLLDVGCGPKSWLWKVGLQPIGIDIQDSYVEAYREAGGEAHLGSADNLPFEANSFHGVWSIGVFHHLPDQIVQGAIAEALRVCKTGGYVAVFDAVLPKNVMTRPLAYGLRKADRGEFMRKQEHLISLFPEKAKWQIDRFTYAYTGLEMLSIVAVKDA